MSILQLFFINDIFLARNLSPVRSTRKSHKAYQKPKNSKGYLSPNKKYAQFHKFHMRESAGINAFERKYGGNKKVKL